MRKTYEECIELGNNRSIDDIVDQKHILEESLRHLFSRRCFQAGATDITNYKYLDKPTIIDHGKTVVHGLYEVEGEGMIMFVTSHGEVNLGMFSLDSQIAIACVLEDDNDEYDED